MIRFELRDDLRTTTADPAPPAAGDAQRRVGYAEDIVCRTDSTTLVDRHLKRLSYQAAIREGRVELIGPPRLTRQFRTWFRTSPFADFVPAECRIAGERK